MFGRIRGKKIYYRLGISIALVSHSLDHSLDGVLSRSLIGRLIPSGAIRGWCAVRTLQTALFKQALSIFPRFFHSDITSNPHGVVLTIEAPLLSF